jgi:hypothetical protein
MLLACIDLVNQHQLDCLEFNGIKIIKTKHLQNAPLAVVKKMTPEEAEMAAEEELFWSARKS